MRQTELLVNGRFLTQSLTGVQRFAGEMAKALHARQHVKVLAPKGGAAAFAGAVEVGRRQGQVWEQWELPRAAGAGVLINLGNTAPVARRRQLVVIHDAGVFSTPEAYSTPFRLWYRTMQTLLVKRGVPVVTVSEFSRGEIMRHLQVPAGQISVIPEGADHVGRIVAEPGVIAREQLTQGRFVLAVGTLAAHKNLIALQELAVRLAERGVPLVIVGSLGGMAFRAEGMAGLPAPARYIGRVNDGELKALYEHAGCFVFPSRYEGFGLPVVEAMASGCPVVAAAIPVLREIAGEAALFCDPADGGAIAGAVLRVLDDAPLQETLREAGRVRTAAMTWAAAADALLAVVASRDWGAA